MIAGMSGVLLLAIFFRFYDIQNYPPGLFPDEAANGEDVLLILDGDIRPFYPRGNGREGLFFLLQAASVWLFGVGVWQLHVVAAFVGVLTVWAMYFASRVWFGRLAGVIAALLLATNHWHVTLSRTGFRAILIPLFVLLFTAWVGYTIQSVKRQQIFRSYWYAILAGMAWAGGFYTYIAYRVMVGVVIGVAILLALAALHPKIGFPHWRRYGKQLAVGMIAAVIVLTPLGWYFVQHPEAVVGRAGQVSVFSSDLQKQHGGGTLSGTLVYSASETLLAFFAGQSDLNWRHNVAGFPLLNQLTGLLFLLGLAWAIRGFIVVVGKIIQGTEVHLGMIYAYLLLLLAGMLVPVIMTAEGMPHGLRSIGLLPPIFMLAGTAAAVMVHWGMKKAKLNQMPKRWTGVWQGVVVGVLALSVLYDGALYFLVARNDADAHYAYRADLTEVSKYINEYVRDNADKARPYLVLDKFSVQTVHWLTTVAAHEYTIGDEAHPDVDMHKWELLDPATSHLTPLGPGEVIIFTQSTIFDAKRYEQMYPEIKVREKRMNRFGQEIMRVYGLEAGDSKIEGVQDEKEEKSFDLDAG